MNKLLAFVCVLAVAALFATTPTRGVDPDELEHIHATCSVAWGELPYRDFFEHHGPALYYMLQPVVRWTGPETACLWWGRAVMACFGLATLGLTALLANHLYGRAVAFAAPALLAATTVFFWKTMEVRPDVPAMFLVTFAAYVALRSWASGGVLPWLATGLLLGLATLFTQKAIVPAGALGLALLVALWRERLPGVAASVGAQRGGSRGGLRASASLFLGLALGGAAVWLVTASAFLVAGGLWEFLHGTVAQLSAWPVRHNAFETFRTTLTADLAFWMALVLGILESLAGLRHSKRPTDRAVLPLSVLACVVGAFVVKAAYPQYYLLWFPLAAVVAADALVRLASAATEPGARWYIAVGLLALLAIEGVLAGRAVLRGGEGSLPNLVGRLSTPVVAIVASILLLAPSAAGIVCLIHERRAGAVASLAVLGLAYGGLRNLDALSWSNREQVAAIQRVNALVGAEESVFDGFTGLGAFRRHAYYYWWINPYSFHLMTPEDREEKLVSQLREAPPRLVLFDDNLRSLPDPVKDWIRRNYEPVEPSPLYLRREGASLNDHPQRRPQ